MTIFKKPAVGLRQRLTFDDFHIIEQVGEGTYGRVFKARNKHTNKLTALKVVFPTEDDEGLPFTAVREIKYLQMLHDNPNVIKLEGTFFTKDGELVLAFEYMENDLSGLLSLKNLQFTPAQTKCLFKQVLEGLHQCHSAGIMHRDIKAANLLLNNGQLKLADFGLASNYARRRTFSTNVVTLWYRAPELLLGVNTYGPKVDIWSAGCLFIELLTRQSPFPGREEKHQLELIVRTCGTPDERNWPGVTKLEGYKLLQGLMGHKNRLSEVFGKFDPRALDLLSKMLALNPAQRPTASEALDHDYFWADPLPCKATELPHYPAMHEYEAKKTRQNERQPKRQKVSNYAPNPYPSHHHQGYPSGAPAPQSSRGDYAPPPHYPHPSYPSKPGQTLLWVLTGDPRLTERIPKPTGTPPLRAMAFSRRLPSLFPPPTRCGRPATQALVDSQAGMRLRGQWVRGHLSITVAPLLHRRPCSETANTPPRPATPAQLPPAGRSAEYSRVPREHRPPTSAAMAPSSLGGGGHHLGGPRHDMPPMASYNRPPAGAHRPHHHLHHHQQLHHPITDGHASAAAYSGVHRSHARATLSSVERMEVGVDTMGKRKREAAVPL
ncbi:Cyclindependent kinase [Acanthamoeba castellanii str. Neff]|uniref:[RNA-polymerase]-subunit kinase n=1 Tax=Acanthamoeba castellanii (strain ATCC 30010 / Neff) TaxID=1257118 RepID=L8GN38_ACACF|nr:Cyclindependent kinase [Acanthamoeba castellanii str. Neff]ELR13631.1 Cyclindependent kinase [Acanthamoeba castellanii str. Neff]